MANSVKSLALSFVTARGMATIMMIDKHVRENSVEPPLLDEVFAVMAELVQEQSVSLLDGDDYTFGPSVLAQDIKDEITA
jgi:hypothetical protein